MKLTRLCKAANSVDDDDCPAMYVANDPVWMVGQGKKLDDDTTAELLSLADDEVASLIPTETVLRAAGLFLSTCGRPQVAAEIEEFLAEWLGVRS